VSGQLQTPAVLTLVPIRYDGEWTLEMVWTTWRNDYIGSPFNRRSDMSNSCDWHALIIRNVKLRRLVGFQFHSIIIRLEGRISSVGIATACELDNREVGLRVPGSSRIFSLLVVHTGYGDRTVASFAGDKAAGA
jgi:hypothetical protein